MDFKNEIVKVLVKETKLKSDDIERTLSVPPDPKLGDYAYPCFSLGKNPKEAAEKLQKKIKLPTFLEKIEVVGPYLNFFLNKSVLAEDVLIRIEKEKETYGNGKSKKNIVIEYCGPNTNKPLHIGHLRNMAIGQAVFSLLGFQGNEIHPVNIVNDRGIHICKSMLAYQKWGRNLKPDKKGDHFVGDYYVLFDKKSKKDEDLSNEAQEMLLRWERGDKETRVLWKKMNDWVLDGFAETYKRFGVKFDKEYFESQYYEQGKDLVLEGLGKKVFTRDHTEAILAPLEKYKLSDKVLLRGDETSLYITQDLYLAELRHKDFNFDKMIYVVASEQKLHFQQLFKILELLGRKYSKDLYHLSYGMVHLPSGRMKSREGTVVDGDDIMDEMAALAEKEVRSRYKDLPEKEIKSRSDAIGIAAIKFFMLRTDAARDIIFNPEESLSFEGETGPYLQYTHARSCSILRKGDLSAGNIDFKLLDDPTEYVLLSLLSKFPERVEESAENLKPHILCRYLLDLAQAFNEFYHACPVISEIPELMRVRLLLVDSVRTVLSNGLGLLGIEALAEM
jgi:arginyl-tRNA synthetase